VSSAEIIRKLKAAGWKLVRTKGSHQHYSHPASPGRVVTVPHPKKDIGLGLAKAIEKASGVQLLP
jgi:predicted RNA binding protein YcfA (HicA-like mRNA interferase family)